MIRLIAKTLKILNSETEPGQISLGIAFGMVAGITPLMSLHNLLVLLLVCMLRVNISTFILSTTVFTGIAYAVDPLSHAVGLAVLQAGSLEGLFTSMYNNVLFRIEHFNNTIVMGSLVIAVVLFVPVLLLGNVLIRKYREHILAWVMKSNLMKAFTASRFYGIYQKVSGWRDAV